MGLSFWSVLNFLGFNGVAALAVVSHIRGTCYVVVVWLCLTELMVDRYRPIITIVNP